LQQKVTDSDPRCVRELVVYGSGSEQTKPIAASVALKYTKNAGACKVRQ